MRKHIGKILLLVTVIFLIVFACFCKYYIFPQKNLINTNKISVILNGKSLNFHLLTYKTNDQIEHDLVYNKNFFTKTKVKLTGFEDSVELCQNNTINLGGVFGDVICLTHDVGAHSQNLEFIRFQNNQLNPIDFIDQSGQESPNIFSDEPAIYFNDYNGDDYLDVIVLNRDYDNNPLVDSIKNYYKNDGGKFVFDKALNFTYHNN